MQFQGKVAVVTGGGSGMGRELVLALLKRGAAVAAVDRNAETLAETVRLAGAGAKVSVHVVDVTDRPAVDALPDAVETALGPVDILINNAGVIQPFDDFADLSYEVMTKIINVNLWGTIHMTKAFMPRLQQRPSAYICNTSSMGGFIPFPGQTMYSATKAAVKLMTEGIYAETIGTNIGVSVVMPGAVATNIADNSGVKIDLGPTDAAAANRTLPAPEAARLILDGIAAERLHILVGKDARMLDKLVRIAPAWAIRFIQKQMAVMKR